MSTIINKRHLDTQGREVVLFTISFLYAIVVFGVMMVNGQSLAPSDDMDD